LSHQVSRLLLPPLGDTDGRVLEKEEKKGVVGLVSQGCAALTLGWQLVCPCRARRETVVAGRWDASLQRRDGPESHHWRGGTQEAEVRPEEQDFLMSYYVYILQSESSGRYYCGQTSDLECRIEKRKGVRS
jgi:hypothetical protein